MSSILSSNNWYPQSNPNWQVNPQASNPQYDPVASAQLLVQQIMGSNDRNAAFQQIIASSPEAQQAMNLIMQYGNGDPKAAMINMAAAQGRTAFADQVIQKFGLK